MREITVNPAKDFSEIKRTGRHKNYIKEPFGTYLSKLFARDSNVKAIEAPSNKVEEKTQIDEMREKFSGVENTSNNIKVPKQDKEHSNREEHSDNDER